VECGLRVDKDNVMQSVCSKFNSKS